MILSASGWRKVFVQSGNEEDTSSEIGKENTALAALIAESFAEYMTERTGKAFPTVAIGMDTRPTGTEIAEAVLKVLCEKKFNIHFTGIISAPEIFSYARSLDGFLYISASHNPIGHNGIKFGMNDGGVIDAEEAKKLSDIFKEKCASPDAESHAEKLLSLKDNDILDTVHQNQMRYKKEALEAYESFIRTVITGSTNKEIQDSIFSYIKNASKENTLSIACDMNGSSRTLSIDKNFIPSLGLNFYPFNNEPGKIAHAIIPEPENLVHCANVINDMQADGDRSVTLGYMPDCDGDRGNLVYWDSKENEAKPIKAQEVFALCVVAETAFEFWKNENIKPRGLLNKAKNINGEKLAVCVNCPTSMRIDSICRSFNTDIFRAEVGEANVVNLAREKRKEGYTVRILGEGSNGGNITHPSCVRDPLATLFAIVKLLTIRDVKNSDGTVSKGLFHIWCEKSNQEFRYKNDFTLLDVLESLPKYKTTGVSEERAVLKIESEDKGLLKDRFKTIFLKEWENHKEEMEAIYGIKSFKAVLTNGTKERFAKENESWNNSSGGLKILFYNAEENPIAFIWMRASGTEPVFRVMCDIQGEEESAERSLLRWETSMIKKADTVANC